MISRTLNFTFNLPSSPNLSQNTQLSPQGYNPNNARLALKSPQTDRAYDLNDLAVSDASCQGEASVSN
jgi:hypothetical protein